MKTILWLGAHKTGTTYLQKSLDLSQDILRAHGVFYLGLAAFRQKYGRPLLGGDNRSAEPSVYGAPGTRLNLIFDENIAAYVQHVLRPDGFYHDVTRRTDRVLRHLSLVPDEIVFGVRTYDQYLPSLYCETLKSTPFKTFEEYLVRSFRSSEAGDTTPTVEEFASMNWASVITRLERHYRPARVRVYVNEQLRDHEAALLSSITTVPAPDLRLLAREERVGFSGRAVERLHEIHRERVVTFQDVRQAVREFPVGKAFRTFRPFDDAERDFLAQRYHADVRRLRGSANVDVIELS